MSNGGIDVIRVVVESDWWSRINWTQAIATASNGLFIWSAGKFNVEPAIQLYVVFLVQGFAGLLTIWFRRTTTTITPTAAKMIAAKDDTAVQDAAVIKNVTPLPPQSAVPPFP